MAGCLLTRACCKYLRGTVDIKITQSNGYTSLNSKRTYGSVGGVEKRMGGRDIRRPVEENLGKNRIDK